MNILRPTLQYLVRQRKHLAQALYIFTTCVTLFFGSGGVYAATTGPGYTCPATLDPNDCNALINASENWVPYTGINVCGAGTGSTTLSGTDNEQKAFNFFVSPPQNLPAIAAAGIVGNLMAESGVNPRSVQGGKDSDTLPPSIYGNAGYGIAQWTTENRQKNLQAFAVQQGTKDGDLGMQLKFIWKEATTGYQDVIAHIKAAKTPADAATQWMGPHTSGSTRSGGFENPAAAYAHEDVRRANAEKIYKLYAKDTPDAAAVGTGTSGGDCSSTTLTNFVEYKQCNYPQFPKEKAPWANNPYGSDTICQGGCGPSAMAMIITNLTSKPVTPDMTASYGAAHDTTIPGGGSAWNIAQVLANHWGLQSQEVDMSVTKINQVLQSGGLVLATGTGPEPFTANGHFIVIRSVTTDGKWMTGNSAGYDSSKPYTTSEVLASMRNAWAITK